MCKPAEILKEFHVDWEDHGSYTSYYLVFYKEGWFGYVKKKKVLVAVDYHRYNSLEDENAPQCPLEASLILTYGLPIVAN